MSCLIFSAVAVVSASRAADVDVRDCGIELHLEKSAVIEFADDAALRLPAVPAE